jgi:ribosomal protein L12E/L44/L45/RPP1/RPP2
MISDKDKLIYALRGIIENAKVAYEAVTGVSYDEKDDVPEPKDEDPDAPEEDDGEGADEEGSDDD